MASTAVMTNGTSGKANGANEPDKEEIAWMNPGPAAFDFRSRFFR